MTVTSDPELRSDLLESLDWEALDKCPDPDRILATVEMDETDRPMVGLKVTTLSGLTLTCAVATPHAYWLSEQLMPARRDAAGNLHKLMQLTLTLRAPASPPFCVYATGDQVQQLADGLMATTARVLAGDAPRMDPTRRLRRP